MADVIASSPLDPFGIELDLDLRRELSDAEQDEFRRLYELHDLVLVRGDVLTMDEQMRVGELLGPVLMSDTGLMSKDTAIGLAGVELCFHSDYAYSPEPLQAISLHAVDVVDGETSTRFAGGRYAVRIAGARGPGARRGRVGAAGVRSAARRAQPPRRARSGAAEHGPRARAGARSERQSLPVRPGDDNRLDRGS